MGFITYGVQQANIGMDELMMKCPSCEADNFADVMITTNYYHIYYIPIAPFEKEATIICQKCGLRRYHVPFGPKFFKNYYEIKSKFRHPIYTYFVLLFIASLILISIVITVLS